MMSIEEWGRDNAYGNDEVEDTDEAVGTHAAGFPAYLGAKVVAHADTRVDAGVAHDTHEIIDKL